MQSCSRIRVQGRRRSAGDASARAASGTKNESSNSFSSSLNRSGNRRPGRNVTAKTTRHAVWVSESAGPGKSHVPMKMLLEPVVALLPFTFVFARVKVVSKA